jgi:hypothetical protein
MTPRKTAFATHDRRAINELAANQSNGGTSRTFYLSQSEHATPNDSR